MCRIFRERATSLRMRMSPNRRCKEDGRRGDRIAEPREAERGRPDVGKAKAREQEVEETGKSTHGGPRDEVASWRNAHAKQTKRTEKKGIGTLGKSRRSARIVPHTVLSPTRSWPPSTVTSNEYDGGATRNEKGRAIIRSASQIPGRVDWIRTSDPLTPSQVRYQTAPPPGAAHLQRKRRYHPAIAGARTIFTISHANLKTLPWRQRTGH